MIRSSQCTHWDFLGAAMNLTTYSKVNQPTKTASAISKKFSSSAKIGFKTRLRTKLVGTDWKDGGGLFNYDLISILWMYENTNYMREMLEWNLPNIGVWTFWATPQKSAELHWTPFVYTYLLLEFYDYRRTYVWCRLHLSVETGAALRIWGTKWTPLQTCKRPLLPPGCGHDNNGERVMMMMMTMRGLW